MRIRRPKRGETIEARGLLSGAWLQLVVTRLAPHSSGFYTKYENQRFWFAFDDYGVFWRYPEDNVPG